MSSCADSRHFCFLNFSPQQVHTPPSATLFDEQWNRAGTEDLVDAPPELEPEIWAPPGGKVEGPGNTSLMESMHQLRDQLETAR